MQRFRRSALSILTVLLVSSCGKAPDPKEAAQQFFDKVASGNTQQAHNDAAFAFQAGQSARVFDQTAKELGLIGAKGVTLEPLESEGKTAKFNAVVTTATGEQRTYILTLQKESGAWKLFSIRTPRNLQTGVRENYFSLVGKGASFTDALNQPMPDEKAVRQLVSGTLKRFNDAIRQKSFADFYASVSSAWQAQLNEKQLARAFQPFVDQNVDISGALAIEPVFDVSPQITTDGLLLLAGHYPSKPYQVEFSLKFVYELPDWKLFGIDVNLRKPKE